MRFLISDSFAKSIARLDDRDRRAVQCAAFSFQMDPRQPSLRLHKLAYPRDAGLWSLCVNRDLRIIVHRDGADVAFCYADHHEKAYAWAERHRGGARPYRGAISLAVSERTRDAVVAPEDERPALAREPPCNDVEQGARPAAPVLEPSRRHRTRARAAAPLADRPMTLVSELERRPLAQLLRLACRLGVSGAQPAAAAPPDPDPPTAAERAVVRHGRAGLPLPRKIWTISLLAAPLPILASVVAWMAASHGFAYGVVHLVPGLAGALLLACTGLAAARSTSRAIRTALSESERIRDRVRSGSFGGAGEQARVDPALRPMLRAAEETVEAFAVPFDEATATLVHLARGELTDPLAEVCGGEFDRQRDAINALASFIRLRPEDLRSIIGGDPPAADAKPAHIDTSGS